MSVQRGASVEATDPADLDVREATAMLGAGDHFGVAGVSLIAARGREAPLAAAAIDLQEHALGVPRWRAAIA